MNALNHCNYSALVSWATFFFSQVLNSNYSAKWHCSYNSYSFFFFFLLNIYVSWYIYCYIDITNFTIFSQLLTCVNALKHCSYNALVSWAAFFSQVLNSNYNAKEHCRYNSYSFFFFPFKYLCKLVYILLYWHNKFHNIFTIIDMSISYKSK